MLEHEIDYYAILEIAPDSDSRTIRDAYRVLLQVWHPDRFQHNETIRLRAEERVKLINTAYEVLSDTAARNTYDAQRAQSPPPTSSAPPPPQQPGSSQRTDYLEPVSTAFLQVRRWASNAAHEVVTSFASISIRTSKSLRRSIASLTPWRILVFLFWFLVWLVLATGATYGGYFLVDSMLG